MGGERTEFGQSAPVTLHEVSVRYGVCPALTKVTATFPSGITGLLGSNGAGKSTLMLAILGLVQPESGRIEVLGMDAARSPREIRARLGYMSERDAYIPGLSAILSVAYCGELAGLPREDAMSRAHEVLSFVGLNEVRYREAETFSTGMKQWLKLAQALVHGPELLLLDEPTDGLDPRGRDQMLELIRELGHRQHLNVIFSSHLLTDIERACDAFVALHAGSVAAAGDINDWRGGTDGAYEVRVKGNHAGFVAAANAMGLDCETVDGETLRIVIADGDVRPVFAVASRLGVQIRHFVRQRPTLDDMFERVTGREGARWPR